MDAVSTPLRLASLLTAWRLDVSALGLAVIGIAVVAWCRRRRGASTSGRSGWWLAASLMAWLLATTSVVATYAPVLFWMRAVQVQMLLLIVPFLLAKAAPITGLRSALAPSGRDRLDRLLGSRFAAVAASPATTSLAMLATPWLLYLTPWYTLSLQNPVAGGLTQVALVIVGFGYFYARLQVDPVPRRYHQLISVVITMVESIADGLLGLVLWLGPMIAVAYYAGMQRDWGPTPRTDQSIGAGVLWLLGDVLGVPFLVVLLRALSADERVRARDVDAILDRTAAPSTPSSPSGAADPPGGLWWESDPQLRERFTR